MDTLATEGVYTMTATNHDHDGHSDENLTTNVQLSSFNIIGKISPSWSSWFVAVIVEPPTEALANEIGLVNG